MRTLSHCARAIFTLTLLLTLCRRRFTHINTRNHTASRALVGNTQSTTHAHAWPHARLHAHSHNLTPRSRATSTTLTSVTTLTIDTCGSAFNTMLWLWKQDELLSFSNSSHSNDQFNYIAFNDDISSIS
jgi:hypothetical protein